MVEVRRLDEEQAKKMAKMTLLMKKSQSVIMITPTPQNQKVKAILRTL